MTLPPKKAIEWPTLLMLALTYAVWAAGTLFWDTSALISLILTGVAIAQFSSLQHEALHGHPFRHTALNEAAVFPALTVFLPYGRFRDTHLQHHFDPALTDPYDDPESNYRDPAQWASLSRPVQMVLRWNNTLAGRMVLGPTLSMANFLATELALVRRGDASVITAWVAHAGGLALVALWLAFCATMPVWAYLMSVYLALSLLRIRTFLEHRAHTTYRSRTVVIEDRGPLSLLFLNNNFHVVHHMHPNVPWYELPALYASRKAHFLRRNDSYVYRNYAEIFRKHLWRAKDPVPHPIWPVPKSAPSDDA